MNNPGLNPAFHSDGNLVKSLQPDIPVNVIEADLDRPEHQQDVRALTAAYALDPMGNGGPLSPEVLEHLIPSLKSHPTTLIFLAYKNSNAVGLATCFRGFSTFAARPLINISDLAVLPEYRGMGIGRLLLAAVEQKARQSGCCKVTLEVQDNNAKARRTYERAGFTQAVYGPDTGGSLYYWKSL
jgi:GNAT superfamily N-acetyltransferase